VLLKHTLDLVLSYPLTMRSHLAAVAALVPFVCALPAPDWNGENLLVPDKDGVLKYASPAQVKARRDRIEYEASHSIQKRDYCSDGVFMGDLASCGQYCEHQVKDIVGAPVQVSASITCNIGDTCNVAHTNSIAIQEGFSITIGGQSAAGPEGNALITGGASFSWSKTETTSNTWTFNPKEGQLSLGSDKKDVN
jgi:hypothetical protein